MLISLRQQSCNKHGQHLLWQAGAQGPVLLARLHVKLLAEALAVGHLQDLFRVARGLDQQLFHKAFVLLQGLVAPQQRALVVLDVHTIAPSLQHNFRVLVEVLGNDGKRVLGARERA